jgi:predicted dehydrogenase
MAPFRLGLVGAGRMGRTHLRTLAGSKRVVVTAIAEMSPAARETAARETAARETAARETVAREAPGVTLHASVAEMLTQSSLDGVLIVAPTDQQRRHHCRSRGARAADPVRETMWPDRRGRPRAAEVAAAAGVALQVTYWRRFVPALQRLHDRIASGELGVIHLVTCYQWDEQPPSAVFRAQRRDRDRHGSAPIRPAALADRPEHRPPGGGVIGRGANQAADLLEGWPEAHWTPGFREGAAVQAVCDAMETSAASGRWVKVSEVTSAAPPRRRAVIANACPLTRYDV